MVKLFVYLQDCAVDGGETACVPGTHRLAGSPREVLARPFRFDTMGEEARAEALPQAAMPNLVRAALKAGSAVLFDSSCWHASMPNLSGSDRCGAHFSYRSSECYPRGEGTGLESRNMPFGDTCGLSKATLLRLDAEGKLGVVRRRILGLPDLGTGEGGRAAEVPYPAAL